jgi:NAD(P)-dependent dehydrogenase (short-subunit alcohol dehydrogenase family)
MSDPYASISGKTCIITGGTSGIGAAAALGLARRGARIAIVGRNPHRCEEAARSIAQRAGAGSVEWLACDLSSQVRVRRLASECLARFPRIDVLVNNAGAIFEYRQESVDDVEMTLALNHLGPFVLTNLLLERLKQSVPSRVITVSSGAHTDVPSFDFDDPEAKRTGYPTDWGRSLFYSIAKPWGHPAFVQYAQTKLANLLFAFELARRLEGSGVTSNALDPGLVATNFSAHPGVYMWFMRRYGTWFGVLPEEGAKTIVHLAAAPDIEGVTGAYFKKEQQAEPSAASRDFAAAQRLWRLSEEMTAC